MTRRLFHQIHLWLSLPLGILFAVICLTGAILVFENEALQLLNPQADVSSMRKHDPARRELTGYGFFRETLRLHRWLLDAPAKKGERSAGKEVVGYGTLAMTAVLLSGVVVWWPRNKKVLRNREKKVVYDAQSRNGTIHDCIHPAEKLYSRKYEGKHQDCDDSYLQYR